MGLQNSKGKEKILEGTGSTFAGGSGICDCEKRRFEEVFDDFDWEAEIEKTNPDLAKRAGFGPFVGAGGSSMSGNKFQVAQSIFSAVQEDQRRKICLGAIRICDRHNLVVFASPC
ncbi:unnamed protein product [Calypogeia fissa]